MEKRDAEGMMVESLNMDFTKKVVINTEQLEWTTSPSPDVFKKPLEMEQQEAGHVTFIEKYEPGARLTSHSHPKGEEIFVLEGTFSDEFGEYPSGTYLRNPPGSSHAPFSKDGCVLFVKHNQFLEGDSTKVVLDTNYAAWVPGFGKLKVLSLHLYEGKHTALVYWPEGATFQPHAHHGGEEILVLNGTFQDEHNNYPKGTWIRSHHLSQHNPFSKGGCLILVKIGHLI